MEPFFIDGKKFISSKEASNITGYAQDYISRLCRGKKIRGRLVGKNWFINLESLVEFNADQMVAAQKRRLELVSSSKGVRATAPKHSQSTSLFKEMAERALVAATPSRATASIAEATQKSIHAVTHAATSSLALRLQAAAMASFFAFGTIFLFAPSYAAFAVNSTRDEGQQIASSLLHTDASALASQTSDAFVAAAADSENQLLQTVASIEQRAQKFAASLARTLHSAWSNHALLALRPTTQEAAAPAAMGSSAAPPPVSNSHTTTTAGSSTPSPIVNNYYTTNKNFTGGAPTPPVSQGTNTVLIRGGVSESELTSKLQALSDLFNAQINSSVLPSISTLSRQISLSQKVDQITGATFNNVTVSGVSGLAAADIPDLSYLPLAGGTLTGALTLSSALGSGSGGLGTSTWQTGSLPYFNGTRFTEDNANFFWDGTNHRLGLGTTTPAALLSLQQITNGTPILSAYRVTDTAPSGDFIDYYSKAGTTLFRVDNSGNLLAGGIINSGSQTITSASQPQLRLQSDASNEITTSVSSQGTTTIAINGTFPALLFTPQSNAVNQFSFTDAASNSILSIDTANKRIGIGTTTPFAKFAVSLNSGENYPNDNAFVISSSTASATTTLFVVQNSGNVAIGTTTADAKLTISGNTSALPALPTVGTNIHLVGANSGQVNITMDGFAAAPQIITRRAQGTAASPSAVNFAGFNLFNYEISGYGTTGYSTPQNIINVLTDEGWTDSAQGNRITIATTKNGTTGAIERLRITNAGLIGIGNTSPANQLDIGVGTDATAKTGAFSTLNIANTATSSTASVNKTGLQISSTGSWTGTGASNIGLLVSSVTGGTNNYDAIFNGGGAIGIGTTTPYGKFAISLNSGQTYTGNNVFIIASSTSAATTTLFKVDNAGNVAANTRFAFNADGSSTLGQASIDTSGNISLASNNTKLSSAGTLLLQTNNTGVSSAAFIAGSGMLFGFASGAGAFNATLDTGISRISAGVIGFGTGAAASTAGTIVASSAGLGTTTPYGKFAL
ncbi:MAG TPA: hypothetical protein VN495_03795, partial [Candidatus Paceibacterota bacterium]|nr:hypothetical protein [Candidatus Paceibacterota bacterium]